MKSGDKILQENEREGALWAASIIFVQKIDNLLTNQITALCTVCPRIPKSLTKLSGIANMHIPIEDHPDQIQENHKSISQILQKSYNFIEQHRKKRQNVVVHCILGISRTATIITYYLMKKYNIPYQLAIQYLQSRRPSTKINEGFSSYLKQLSIPFQKSSQTFLPRL